MIFYRRHTVFYRVWLNSKIFKPSPFFWRTPFFWPTPLTPPMPKFRPMSPILKFNGPTSPPAQFQPTPLTTPTLNPYGPTLPTTPTPNFDPHHPRTHSPTHPCCALHPLHPRYPRHLADSIDNNLIVHNLLINYLNLIKKLMQKQLLTSVL